MRVTIGVTMVGYAWWNSILIFPVRSCSLCGPWSAEVPFLLCFVTVGNHASGISIPSVDVLSCGEPLLPDACNSVRSCQPLLSYSTFHFWLIRSLADPAYTSSIFVHGPLHSYCRCFLPQSLLRVENGERRNPKQGCRPKYFKNPAVFCREKHNDNRIQVIRKQKLLHFAGSNLQKGYFIVSYVTKYFSILRVFWQLFSGFLPPLRHFETGLGPACRANSLQPAEAYKGKLLVVWARLGLNNSLHHTHAVIREKPKHCSHSDKLAKIQDIKVEIKKV